MRYRLYEIDRLINRTLVYVTLTAALAATFAAVSLTLGVAIGSGSTLPTAAATLAVALRLRAASLARPDSRRPALRSGAIRGPAQDRALPRGAAGGPRGTGGNGRGDGEAIGDPGLELFFWLPAEQVHVDALGRAVDELPIAGRARTPVRRGGLQLATVVHDRALGRATRPPRERDRSGRTGHRDRPPAR